MYTMQILMQDIYTILKSQAFCQPFGIITMRMYNYNYNQFINVSFK